MTDEKANFVVLLPRTETWLNDLKNQKDPTEQRKTRRCKKIKTLDLDQLL